MASWLWVCGLVYANTYLTDGFVPSDGLSAVWPWSRAGRYAARLVQVGLWDKVKDGYTIHDYKDFNPSAQTIKIKREIDRKRKSSHGIHAESNGNGNGIHAESERIPHDASRERAIPSPPLPSPTKKELANQEQPRRLVDPEILKKAIKTTQPRRMNRDVRFR
jgi:hypothetical protein